MTQMSDIRKKTEVELVELVNTTREALRVERFKDKFSRKSSVINALKLDISRSLTELTARKSNDAK
jgi:ribosomal protein L29